MTTRAEDSAIEEGRQLAIGLGDRGELHGDGPKRAPLIGGNLAVFELDRAALRPDALAS
jgi:hypothetical protein